MSISGAENEPSATDRQTQPVSPLFAKRWLRRLAIILFLGVGLLLWKDGRLFPREREINWLTPEDRSRVARIEIQILSPEGTVLKREQFFFRDGAPTFLLQKVALRNGNYRAMIFVDRQGDTQHPQYSETQMRISNGDFFTFPCSKGDSLTR